MDHLIDDADRELELPPEGHPLHKLGARLAELLDEDQFAECEALLLAAGVMPEANESLRAELSAYREDAERYRWLRNRIPGSAYRIAGIIYSEGGVGVDAGIDKARKGEGE